MVNMLVEQHAAGMPCDFDPRALTTITAGGVPLRTLSRRVELEELREHEGVDVKHYLMIDAHFTWWQCGRSYLCRIVDMLHMGYVDEVLFGKEVLARLPSLVEEWVAVAKRRTELQSPPS